ncbi:MULTISPECIES: SIR2 family protein [unclassified Mucilaginibacter]|uniref:SIR2 family NAD-dependent protein deacylase n=1 Tax=unclassified Mucilaginibacter TaxID=2617802 RepID=UPI002AC967D8|nr:MULTISPECIES: SIR2 family protein [unclassified Mucilaginibacter]MEB0280530.1 SIR2 family protein [Mucilaginibacter sp. 10B2]MEB0301130.1 SIR2 family protein [Mucilaginibacter sp. 5C4]WPX22438.1 SIR2 family protein [Mucilaginibacter sp. 5C4]
MALERLFELIRKEDVVLFCGAGMSIYAGYPSGYQLSQLIYEQLTAAESTEIGKGLTLPELTEELVNLRMSRNSLTTILKDIYAKAPKDQSLHHKLAGIPHIKTILTTNYDRLFELAFDEDHSLIRSSADLPYIKKDKPEIFKIHGDLSLPDSILITKTDYTRFFDSQKEDVLWTVVKERLTTHHVLFIGYNLDDVNMESIFRKMKENLGDNHKELFLLAPSLKLPKVQRLIKDGIHYIDSTAEIFVDGLLANIKDHIYEDFQRKWCGPDTFRIFLQKNDLAPTLKTEEDQFKVSGLAGLSKPLTTRMTFGVPIDKQEFIERLENVLQNKELGTVTLDAETVLNLNVYFNDIKISAPDGGGPMTFSSAPVRKAVIAIVFDDGTEYDNLEVELFKTQTHLIFSFPFPNVDLKFYTSPEEMVNLQYELKLLRTGDYGALNDELRTITFLRDIGSGKKFTIHIPGSTPTTLQMAPAESLLALAKKHLYYFERLKLIERHFAIRFDYIGEITKESYNTLNLLIAHMEGKPFLGVFENAWSMQQSESVKITEHQKAENIITPVGRE